MTKEEVKKMLNDSYDLFIKGQYDRVTKEVETALTTIERAALMGRKHCHITVGNTKDKSMFKQRLEDLGFKCDYLESRENDVVRVIWE